MLAPDKTRGPSVSEKSKLVGCLTWWSTFEQEVRQLTTPFLGGNLPRISLDSARFRDQETILCANETGVVSRFHQQIGHVMNNIARDQQLNCEFGDWYDRTSPDMVPDIAIWKAVHGVKRSVVAGEAKTPWTRATWETDLVPSRGILMGDSIPNIGEQPATCGSSKNNF